MEYYVDHKHMKEIDTYAIERIGIPSMVLMERAALAVTQEILKRISREEGRVIILAGTGNNGADGLACARMLRDEVYHTEVFYLGNPDRGTREWKEQYSILNHLGIPVNPLTEGMLAGSFLFDGTSLFVDGLFGIGLSRKIEGLYGLLIDRVNVSGIPVIGIDIPSGVLAENGQIAGHAFRCLATVTFGRKKLGQVLYPGASCCGDLICAQVGFTDQAMESQPCQAWSLMPEDLVKAIHKRPEDGHKGSFGRVLIIAGSASMAGAAVFSARAAAAMGAGLVKVHTVNENRDIVLGLLPEAILTLYDGESYCRESLLADIDWADAIVFGPGLGKAEYLVSMLTDILDHSHAPTVIDADGLRVLAANPHLYGKLGPEVILTPHLGEMSALTGASVKQLTMEQVASCTSFSRLCNCCCIMKSARPVISMPGQVPCINISGNNALATAGSGDVLTGIIAALAGEGYSLWESAVFGTYIHGLAGRLAGKEKGRRGVIASDLIPSLAEVMKLLDEGYEIQL